MPNTPQKDKISTVHNAPALIPIIAKLPNSVPFVGPEALERQNGFVFKARLGANENAFGPAPSVIEAIKNELGNIWQYGDPENYALTHALADFYHIKPENIMIGAGVDALLGVVVRQYIQPDDVVINSLGGYPTFNYHVAGYGGKLITAPYKNDTVDVEALANAARQHKAKIIYIANPDNPLGTWHDAQTIHNFIETTPKDCLIILDEAYFEFAPEKDLIPITKTWPNVLRMRSFSKAYGLAGLRCGYVIGNADLIAPFNKVRDHFSVNRLAQIAALQALTDQNYLRSVIAHNARNRQKISDIAKSHNLTCLPSATNFVSIDCGKDGTYAQAILDNLLKHQIFIRKPAAPIIDRLIRVSVGTDDMIELFAKYFEKALIHSQ